MTSRKTFRIIIGTVSLIIALALIVAYKMYTKPHRSVEDETSIATSAVELFEAFERDEAEANLKYVDKVLDVTGKVSEVSTNMDSKKVIVLESGNLMFGVRCTMQDSLITIETGTTTTIKGICTGYLSDVVITNGILKK